MIALDFALCCLVLAVNSVYACLAYAAAARYRAPLSLLRGWGAAVFAAGTALECVWIVAAGVTTLTPVLVAAAGAAVAGGACDAASGYVFDSITFPSVVLALGASLATDTFTPVALGAAAAGGALALLYALTRGRGLGLGDVKLACCIGAALGALNGLEAIGTAFVLGAAYAVYALLTARARPGHEMRFGPYLAAGMLLVALRGACP